MAYFRFFKVVDVAWLNGYSVVRMSIVYISMKSLTSVFNIPQLEQQQQEPDYRSLYEKQKRLRVFFQKKSKQLESRLRTLSRDGSSIVSKPKQLDICGMLEQIKSFKSLLPYSVKQIPVVDSQCSLDYGLFKEWAVYGIAEEQLARIEQGRKYEGNLVSGNAGPSQILQHTARLVFPSGTTAKVLSGKEALDYSLDIVNLTNEKLKSFVLSFEPNYNKQVSNDNQSRELDILNLLNPERRVYAVCVEVQDFTILEQESKMIQLKTPRKKSEKTVKFKQVQIQPERPCGGLKVVASKRVYCIFTYYPCFSFFEQLLKSLFHAIKVERYITFKQGGQNLRAIDSKFHVSLVKEALEKLRKSANKPIVPDKLMDFQLCGKSKVYLQLSMDSLNFLLAQEWAFSVLSLFTLDVFLDVLTLLMLQQKLVFVCSNPTILTYAVFLFTKILIRPFEYPYPVVNIIPDQQDYLNAPFPVVYGYLKTREEIMANKIPKRYKNVYVVFEPTGVEIISEECKKKILSKKSPRLRDRLISKFKKMQRNFPTTTFFSFLQKKSLEFCFSSNKELARQIIAEVHSYISNDLFRLLPGQGEVATIKTFLATARNIDEDEMNQQVFLRIKEEYSGRTKDPFFSAFLDTQLLNVHIFKY